MERGRHEELLAHGWHLHEIIQHAKLLIMSIESKVLGQQVAYPTDYCPSILVPVPRSLNREIYDIHTPEELFWGFDTWHAYEAGFLARNGLPVCGVLKLVYPANSPCIVESKSLKLYLNSLNMTPPRGRHSLGRRNIPPNRKIGPRTNTANPCRSHVFPSSPRKTVFRFSRLHAIGSHTRHRTGNLHRVQ